MVTRQRDAHVLVPEAHKVLRQRGRMANGVWGREAIGVLLFWVFSTRGTGEVGESISDGVREFGIGAGHRQDDKERDDMQDSGKG